MAHAYISGPATKRTWFCTKVPYKSRREAKIALNGITVRDHKEAQMGQGTLGIYKCQHCKMFHLGHRLPKAQSILNGLR